MLNENDLELIKGVIDQSLEEKLDPIKQDLVFIKNDLEELNRKVDEIKTMETEDVGVIDKDVQKLKNKLFELEKRIELLEPQKA